MTNRSSRPKLVILAGIAALLMAGCNSERQDLLKSSSSSASSAADDGPTPEQSETQRVAEAALGKPAEVLAHGDFARNGLEQILVVNRQSNAAGGAAGPANSAVTITRAAIVEKNGERWTEVLRCDEHLKNPHGYLGNSPLTQVSGWRLEYDLGTKLGLEMKFTPLDLGGDRQPPGEGESSGKSVTVRWNTKVKRYQSVDQSQERYLSEIPTLETPQTILK
jgi:hypothetical protein